MKKIKAWHFTGADRRLRYGDGREVVAGEAIAVGGQPVLCENGLHASRKATNALKYAPGPYVWRVEVSGDVVEGDDKLAGRCRRAIWGFDATDLLLRFARKCALDVVDLWDAPDVVVRFLKTGDGVRAAYVAAEAAYVAAEAAEAAEAAVAAEAYAAAYSAAYAAAYAAARAAEAAYGAVAAEAYAAGYGAVCTKQERRLVAMLHAEARKRGIA